MRKQFRNLILGVVSLAGVTVGTVDAQAMQAPSLGAPGPAASSLEPVWCCRYYGWHRPYWRRPYLGYRRWGWRRRWW